MALAYLQIGNGVERVGTYLEAYSFGNPPHRCIFEGAKQGYDFSNALHRKRCLGIPGAPFLSCQVRDADAQ